MDWLALILKYLDPILAQCFASQSSEDPKRYLLDHYDESTGKMDKHLVRDAMPATWRAIRNAHNGLTIKERKYFPRYSREEVYRITEQRLIDAINASESQLRAAMQAAVGLTDEDE